MTLRGLLVDDSESFLASARRLLESQGVEIVATATHAAQALELAATFAPDVALVDVELGPEDGVALAAKLRSQSSDLKILLISSYGRDEMEELLADNAAAAFLPKNELSGDAIRALLDRDQREAR